MIKLELPPGKLGKMQLENDLNKYLVFFYTSTTIDAINKYEVWADELKERIWTAALQYNPFFYQRYTSSVSNPIDTQ